MKTILIILYLAMTVTNVFAQRILINETFENSGFNQDSLPLNWIAYDVDNTNQQYPFAVWHVRDSGVTFPGVNPIIKSRAYQGHRGVSIPWRAGDPVADDWLFTDSVRIQTGDSLIFWMLFGTPADLPTLTHYIDTMQVLVAVDQDPFQPYVRLATLRSLDSNNIWTKYTFDLSQFNGQLKYICFRYYMNTTIDGLWCNIDNVFVGNHSAIGIQPISNELPRKFDLRQNYPNPFNPTTDIEFDLPRNENVHLVIYNSIGQVVRIIVNQEMKPGSYKVDFDAGNLPSGTYYYRITAGDFIDSKKMVIVK
jgi:type IX secretion system substrate protein